MDRMISAPLFASGLFLGMLMCLEAGRRLGIRRIRTEPEGKRPGLGAVEGAIFALFGLLLAFTFSGAASRLDTRRMQIAEEANAIGTAYLRLDLLPPEAQPALRDLFRAYVDSRLMVFRRLPDLKAALQELAKANSIQGDIWSRAVAACKAPGWNPQAAMLVLPALNEMIDITTTRTMMARTHPPRIIYGLLFALGLMCALLAGYATAEAGRRSLIHMIGFAAITVFTVFVIVDMEYPRAGFIRLDAYDQVLVELRDSMK
jgi:hypothetical protein